MNMPDNPWFVASGHLLSLFIYCSAIIETTCVTKKCSSSDKGGNEFLIYVFLASIQRIPKDSYF